MSVEKKSLISRRAAAKKAIVTKPEANTVPTTKMSHATRTKAPVSRIGAMRISAASASRVKF